MKILKGISALAVLAGVAVTPSFATTLGLGGTVTPGTESGSIALLANTGVQNFSFAGDTGSVEEWVGINFTGNPYGDTSGYLTFLYEVTVTGGHIVDLTGYNYAGTGLDVGQSGNNNIAPNPPFGPSTTQAVSASLTSDGSVVSFSFGSPNGLMNGDTSYLLIVNTDLTQFTSGTLGLLDGGGGTFVGFVPVASQTPEPSTLSLLGTGLLSVGAGLRRRMLRK